jgi:hypothetical protein
VSGDGGSFSYLSYHVGDDWQVRCSTYTDTTPILSVNAGPSGLTITAKGKVAGKAAVEFARALAHEVQRFADEMERMHAAQLDGDDQAAGSDAA